MTHRDHHGDVRRGSNKDTRSGTGSPRGRRRGGAESAVTWKNYGPGVSGWEVTPCFSEGYLFLLIDPTSRQWALYNDTFTYEMHATFVFGADAAVQPAASRNVETTQSDVHETMVTVTVYPMETVVFLHGEKQRYKSTFEGQALSKAYLESERETAAERIADAFNAIVRAAPLPDGAPGAAAQAVLTEEACLARCQAHALPFIDPVFFPGDPSLWPSQMPAAAAAAARVQRTWSLPRTPLSRTGSVSISISDMEASAHDHEERRASAATGPVPSSLTPCAWQRPRDYLPAAMASRVELFRSPVEPRRVQRGRLGDSWFMSALAAVAESDSHVRALFGRSSGPCAEAASEEALGAYRVALNRDGWWHYLVLDDYLPVVGRQPRYARSRDDPCELWVSLMEKAYAKRNGSYANIVSGDPLFALRDLTGFPTMRLDAAYVDSGQSAAAAQAFFSRLAWDVENAHLYMFSTPDTSDPRSTASVFKSNGILIGYAYTAIGTITVPNVAEDSATPSSPGSTTHLVVFRNPFAPVTQWAGTWRAGSPLWERHREAAAAFPGSAAGTDDTIAMVWPEEVHRFFVGCGMAYCHFGYADYRMPCSFVRDVPEVCVEVAVTEPTSLTFILSQQDHRGTSAQGKDYAPVTLSIACRAAVAAPHAQNGETRQSSPHVGYADPHTTAAATAIKAPATPVDNYTLLVHSSWDAEAPSDRFTFLQGRDISITYTFVPERSPYLVVPRRLTTPKAVAAVAVTDDATHRSSTRTQPDDAAAVPQDAGDDLPFVLGVLSQLPFTPLGQAQLRLKHLHTGNPVFDNYATFPNTATEARVMVMAQKQVGRGAVTKESSSLNSL